jgi:hypothetical protein
VEAVLKAADATRPRQFGSRYCARGCDGQGCPPECGPVKPLAWDLDPDKVREVIGLTLLGEEAADA